MKKIFKIIREFIMWIFIIGAFAAIGFTTDTPAQSSLIWAGIAVLIFGVGFLIAKHTKRRTGTTKAQLVIKKIIGFILLVFGLVLPALLLSNFPTNIRLLIVLFAVVLVALGCLAVYLINKSKGWAVLGYLILIIASFLPALAMSTYDMTYNALGTVYYLTIALACFSWAGISMITAKKIK